MPNLVPTRICIHTKDVQNITGKKERTARKLLSDLKQSLGKPKSYLVTIYDFCRYTGLNEAHVEKFLIN
ncbi:MAG: hypothetical protein SFY32_15225 [Bacteroidota bacterium]|nr:hypothetical protein [Bacteroidota bacterium]